jgi:hypothetical protein
MFNGYNGCLLMYSVAASSTFFPFEHDLISIGVPILVHEGKNFVVFRLSDCNVLRFFPLSRIPFPIRERDAGHAAREMPPLPGVGEGVEK